MVSPVRVIAYRPASGSVSLMLSLPVPTVGATSHCPLRQLYALRVPSPFTAPGGGRGASRRSRVAMRRPVAYPIAAGRRWYPAQSQSHRISAV